MRNIDPMAREGMRVRMIHMDDERPVDEGLEGTIEKIDDLGTLHVKWDDGRLLGVIPNEDDYELLPSNEEQIDFDVFEGKDFKTSVATKNNKMAKKVNLNFKRELSKSKPKPKLESKEEETELEETTTAGAAGAFVAPLGNKKDVVRKGFAKQVGTNVVSKGTMKNPLGKIYTLSKKNESKIFKADELLKEITTSAAQRLRDKPGAIDGDAWVGKKGWERKDELLWPGGEIADIMAKLDIDWSDGDLTLTDAETDAINEVKKKNINKEKKKEEDLEEATTFSSVFGGGFPVTPFMWAKKGKHIPSKKSLYKGGKILQKVGGDGILNEEDRIKKNSRLHNEINKIKWVKGGKFVKIKDKCAKYNNKPWCSQGAVDNPLELSDTVFENVKNISKKTGLSEESILDKIKAKLKGVTPEQMEYNKKHGLPIWWQGSKEGFYEKMEPRKNNTGSN